METVPSLKPFVALLMMVVFSAGLEDSNVHVKKGQIPAKRTKHWLNAFTSKPVRNDFWCPTCRNTTQESCDAALTNTTCPKAEFCIALSGKNVFARKCVNTAMLELMTNAERCRKVDSTTTECKRKKRYHVAWCDQSGCKATVVKPIHRTFWCPTCQKTTQQSCDAALTNTTCPKAEFCIAYSDKNVFARKCVNTKMLELMTNAEGCTKIDSTTTECKRKKRYHVAWCDQSGCKATVVKIKADRVPEIPTGSERGIDDSPFRCPTCNKCKSPQECDNNLTMINCPKATKCLALRVNGTTESEHMFARKCINEKAHELIQKACAKKKGCEMSTCSYSGCKAVL